MNAAILFPENGFSVKQTYVVSMDRPTVALSVYKDNCCKEQTYENLRNLQ